MDRAVRAVTKQAKGIQEHGWVKFFEINQIWFFLLLQGSDLFSVSAACVAFVVEETSAIITRTFATLKGGNYSSSLVFFSTDKAKENTWLRVRVS
jgi:hypothetical protein